MTRLLGHCQEAWLVLLLANIELLPRTEKSIPTLPLKMFSIIFRFILTVFVFIGG